MEDLEDTFFADLGLLGELYRSRLAQHLPLRPLARAIGKSKSTVDNWLKDGDRNFPRNEEDLVNLIKQLQALAEHQKVVPQPEHLLDPDTWRARHRAVTRGRAAVIRQGVQRSQALAGLSDAETRARYAALSDKPRALENWSPQQLGVHPAISGSTETDGTARFILPPYIQRQHDRQLQAHLDLAASGRDSVLVILRGESCTGKTRAAFEAVSARLKGWNLVFPKTPESLLAVLAAGALTARTVLWLNDARNFLTGPAGEAAAAALRTQLERPGPVVILGTLWRSDLRDLTGPRPDGFDPHHHARELLGGISPIHVPDSFTEQDLSAMSSQARHDPSLATAAYTSPDGEITQTLAAGPQLVDHYEYADTPPSCFGKAIISVAMDAMRLGGILHVPVNFLKEGAPGYLSKNHRGKASDDWFSHALEYARVKVKNIAAPLEQIPNPTGMGSIPGVYRIADYLDHHARLTRHYTFPPESFWIAAQQCIGDPAALYHLGCAAEIRGRYRIAAGLYQQAAEAGDADAVLVLAGRLWRSGDTTGAERLARQAADSGSTAALTLLAGLRRDAGDWQSAEKIAQQAAQSGDLLAFRFLAGEYANAGDKTALERLASQALPAGDVDTVTLLTRLQEQSGDRQGAERSARQAAQSGKPEVLTLLARMREHKDPINAEQLYGEAIDAGETVAMTFLGGRKEDQGNWEGAERLYHKAIEAGDASALTAQAWMRERALERKSAIRLSWKAADAGDMRALIYLTQVHEENDEREDAEKLARRALNTGEFDAMHTLASLRMDAGDLESAENLTQEIIDAGDSYGTLSLAYICKENGDQGRAEHLAMRALNAGHTDALDYVAWMYALKGDLDARERVKRFGLEADGSVADGL
ncbi:tetratricopeptide repeat protein [Streptomyces lydicus]|uniref:tetratricopeptide repeat protein n=1 Tax=Streptomyces lydicus TaxID=47763 RepID=UPI003438E611